MCSSFILYVLGFLFNCAKNILPYHPIPGVSQDAALAVITLEDAIRLLTDHPEWDGLVINPNTDRYFYLSTAALTAPKRMYE